MQAPLTTPHPSLLPPQVEGRGKPPAWWADESTASRPARPRADRGLRRCIQRERRQVQELEASTRFERQELYGGGYATRRPVLQKDALSVTSRGGESLSVSYRGGLTGVASGGHETAESADDALERRDANATRATDKQWRELCRFLLAWRSGSKSFSNDLEDLAGALAAATAGAPRPSLITRDQFKSACIRKTQDERLLDKVFSCYDPADLDRAPVPTLLLHLHTLRLTHEGKRGGEVLDSLVRLRGSRPDGGGGSSSTSAAGPRKEVGVSVDELVMLLCLPCASDAERRDVDSAVETRLRFAIDAAMAEHAGGAAQRQQEQQQPPPRRRPASRGGSRPGTPGGDIGYGKRLPLDVVHAALRKCPKIVRMFEAYLTARLTSVGSSAGAGGGGEDDAEDGIEADEWTKFLESSAGDTESDTLIFKRRSSLAEGAEASA